MATTDIDVPTLIGNLRDATGRLDAAIEEAVETGGSGTFGRPSRLPGWTVGHVISHLARNADGLRRSLDAAVQGQIVPPYDSPEARERDIQSGAARDTKTIVDDLRQANQRLWDSIDSLEPPAWSATIDLGRGGPTTADLILSARLGEAEVHHHDLGVDGGLALLDDDRANSLLQAMVRTYVRNRGVDGLVLEPSGQPPITIGTGGRSVAGDAIDLVGWLSGRSDGSALRTADGLPELPHW